MKEGFFPLSPSPPGIMWEVCSCFLSLNSMAPVPRSNLKATPAAHPSPLFSRIGRKRKGEKVFPQTRNIEMGKEGEGPLFFQGGIAKRKGRKFIVRPFLPFPSAPRNTFNFCRATQPPVSPATTFLLFIPFFPLRRSFSGKEEKEGAMNYGRVESAAGGLFFARIGKNLSPPLGV